MTNFQSLYAAVVLGFALLVTACQSGAPQEVIDIAMDSVKAHSDCNYPATYGAPCRDLKVARSAQRTLTDADRAKGTEIGWCVQIDYTTKASGIWQDYSAIVYIMKTSGKLKMDWIQPQVKGSGNLFGFCVEDKP